MNEFLKLVAIGSGLTALAALVGMLWRAMRAAVKAEEHVQDVPKLRADFEKFRDELRAETKREAEKLEAKMDTRFVKLEAENNERMERIRTDVDSRFEMVVQALTHIKDDLGDKLSGISADMREVRTDVGWLKRKNGSDGHREERR